MEGTAIEAAADGGDGRRWTVEGGGWRDRRLRRRKHRAVMRDG